MENEARKAVSVDDPDKVTGGTGNVTYRKEPCPICGGYRVEYILYIREAYCHDCGWSSAE